VLWFTRAHYITTPATSSRSRTQQPKHTKCRLLSYNYRRDAHCTICVSRRGRDRPVCFAQSYSDNRKRLLSLSYHEELLLQIELLLQYSMLHYAVVYHALDHRIPCSKARLCRRRFDAVQERMISIGSFCEVHEVMVPAL
jgi:hypothetical protein